MDIQGQNGATRSQGRLPFENGVSLNSGVHFVACIEKLDDQISCGNDSSLKARKPYTITKQRERWTDKEHENFLEALKLYGRAWPQIKEHVGTKTAVQIRSHAQKVFTKILRKTNENNTTFVASIVIPPPRPKRKPSHPYPRKLVEIPNKEFSITEQPLSDFGEENKSPKSALAKAVSHALGSSDSDTTTGSLSPVSSTSGVITSSFPLLDPKTSSEEDRSSPLDGVNGGSAYIMQPLVELEHFSKENVCSKDDATEESSGCTFKLFGTTLLVADICKHSSPKLETIKPIPAVYLMQLQSGCSEIATIVPWWTISHKEPEEKYPYPNLGECEDKEVLKTGSWTGSSTSSVHDEENIERSDDQTRSQVHNLVGHTTPSETSGAISEFRVRSKTSGKGFLPYKRCVAAKRENQCSEVTDEKSEEQCIRLFL